LVGHKIDEVQFFQPNSDDSLGYVKHSYQPSIIYPITNLLIGIAPLLGGTFAFILVTKWLQPEVYDYFIVNVELSNVLNGDLSGFLTKTTSLLDIVLVSSTSASLTALWLFVSYSLIVYSVPSRADLSQSKIGFIFIVVLFLLLSVLLPSALDWIAIQITAFSYIWASVAALHVLICLMTLMIICMFRIAIGSKAFKT
jgi:hypothetical protein